MRGLTKIISLLSFVEVGTQALIDTFDGILAPSKLSNSFDQK